MCIIWCVHISMFLNHMYILKWSVHSLLVSINFMPLNTVVFISKQSEFCTSFIGQGQRHLGKYIEVGLMGCKQESMNYIEELRSYTHELT